MRASRLHRGVVIPLAVGLVAAALTLVYGVFAPRHAMAAWVAAYGFGAATVLGGLILVMVLHVTGAKWWLALRRVFISVAGTTPLLALLFVPIAFFLGVYPWHAPTPPVSEHLSEVLEHQRLWNQPAFYVGRAVFYLATWTVLSTLLRRADAAYLRAPSRRTAARERTIAGAGLPILAFTLTFASFDWLMSMQAGWTSTMFGLYVFTSGLTSALAVIAVGSWLAARSGLLPEAVEPDHFHAVGRLMLMSVILWAYIGFFQFMLVWIADLPHEVGFYSARARGSWSAVDWVLFVGRFAVPFLLLLSRPLKRSPGLLALLGGWLLAMSALDFEWIVVPASGARLSPADVLPFVSVGALLWAYGAHLASARGRVPERRLEIDANPALKQALRYRSP